MKKILTPEQRLIVAADFEPDYSQTKFQIDALRCSVRDKVLRLADTLAGTGVYLKVNFALRALGYSLISQIQSRGLRVFADLKLFDISKTLSSDGLLLLEEKPELLTTVCAAGIGAMQALKAQLRDTELLGVTVLTSLKNADTQAMYGCSVEEAVMRFARVAAQAEIGGLICSPKEVEMLRVEFGSLMSLNTPAIRPKWASVLCDDQNPERSMTPEEAIRTGADRIVVGRPIVNAQNPYDAVMRTIEEIALAMD